MEDMNKLKPEDMQKIIAESLLEAAKVKMLFVEAYVRSYIASTGAKPEELVMVQEDHANKVLFYLKKKSELGIQ